MPLIQRIARQQQAPLNSNSSARMTHNTLLTASTPATCPVRTPGLYGPGPCLAAFAAICGTAAQPFSCPQLPSWSSLMPPPCPWARSLSLLQGKPQVWLEWLRGSPLEDSGQAAGEPAPTRTLLVLGFTVGAVAVLAASKTSTTHIHTGFCTGHGQLRWSQIGYSCCCFGNRALPTLQLHPSKPSKAHESSHTRRSQSTCIPPTFADAVTSRMFVRLSSKNANGFFTSTNGSLAPNSSKLGFRQLRYPLSTCCSSLLKSSCSIVAATAALAAGSSCRAMQNHCHQ